MIVPTSSIARKSSTSDGADGALEADDPVREHRGAAEITSTTRQIRTSRTLTSTCESSGFVSAKSSFPSRTSSISRCMFGWIAVLDDAAEQDLNAHHDEQLRLAPPVQLVRVRVDER